MAELWTPNSNWPQMGTSFVVCPRQVQLRSEGLVPLIRFLSLCAAAVNRVDAGNLVKAGRVTVNNEVALSLGALVSLVNDTVRLDNETLALEPRPHRHILLHKPNGYLTKRRIAESAGAADPRPTVYDLLGEGRRCEAIGRLDVDTTGALLFTSDGVLAYRLLDPQQHVTKRYRATLRPLSCPPVDGRPFSRVPTPLSEDGIRQLAAGVTLQSRQRTVSGTAFNVAGAPGDVLLDVTGGAYHQVRTRRQR
jgi:16S rRNA U516 pseudouridylate synthase RsuA-like enzyme